MLYEKILDLGIASFKKTSDLSYEDWLELRTTGIGGSDAGAILGLNKYATPLSIYLSKKDFSSFGGNEATKWGTVLEEPIRDRAREELGIEIETVPGMFTSKDHSFMNANLDGLVFVDEEKEIAGQKVLGLGGHEIKTSRTGDGFSSDEIPDSYYAQVQHYMAVTGLDFFILTVFIFNSYSINHYVVRRNEDFIREMIESEKDFWENYVLAGIAPAPTGNKYESDVIKSLPMPEEVELGSEYETLLEQRADIEEQIKELEKKSESIKSQIILAASKGDSDADKTIIRCGSWKITCDTQVRKSVDSKALKEAGLYDQFCKESSSKVVRFSRTKG